ncbi:RagB/SusD family nutrient uptake outer membrane protein, partial [Parafilimonas sp.]|uniref:RagB/SusD family nutrient uptake outer membrane protein n=1 Tax=Parafilimonas sp. TaxID=1969739 RepID=UPI0039E2ED9F
VSGSVTTNTYVLNMYRQEYQIIARANQIFASIDDVDFDEDSKNNIKGQAYFLRAYAYFELVRLFGAVPLHLTPVTTREEAALPLTSVDSIYDQIISDASQAVSLLPLKSVQETGRVTSGAAETLLANVYIVLKNWSAAQTLLDDVVQSGEYSLMADYNDAFSESASNKNNAESVFEVQFLEGSEGYNSSFIYSFLPRPMTADELESIVGVSNPQSLTGEGNNIPTPDIINAYEDNDERKDASIAYITLSTSLRTNKVFPYIKKYAKTHSVYGITGTDWPVYRYAEVLLFLAEALNEQGEPAKAATYINMVRSRAGLGATTAASQADMRSAIFQERRVELAFENKRWFDLVRADSVNSVITAYGARVVASPADYYYSSDAEPPSNAFTNLDTLYPLPADESDLTPYF